MKDSIFISGITIICVQALACGGGTEACDGGTIEFTVGGAGHRACVERVNLLHEIVFSVHAAGETPRPFSVDIATLPAVEIATPAWEMMVPTMMPPPPALMVAALPTCQKTFFACAPLASVTLCGNAAPGPPTVSVVAIWKTQTAFALPCASSVRLPPRIRNEPDDAV